MTRAQMVLLIAGAAHAMIDVALATQAVQPPVYTLPPLAAFIMLIVNAGITYILVQARSWEHAAVSPNN